MNSSKPATTDEARIRALIEAWAKAVRAKDIEGIMAHHAPDILLFDVPPPVQLRGAGAYRKSWDRFFDWFQDSRVFNICQLSITASDDVACCHGLIQCGGPEVNGEPIELTIRLTVCLRQIDGQWIITHEHHSETSPAA